MSRLNASYLERKLRAAVGLVGGEVLKEMPDLSGLITLESDRPEWRAPANEFLWGIGRNVAAVVGQSAFVGVHNRAGTGILSVVKRINVSASGGALLWSIGLNFPDSALPGDGVVFFRDLRIAQAGSIAATRRLEGTSATPPFGSVVHRGRCLADSTYTYDCDLLLPPNSELTVVNAAFNQNFDVSIEGYERPIEGLYEIK